MSDGTIHARPGSSLRPFAETIGWLWRVPLSDEPDDRAVAFGTVDEAPDLAGLLGERRLAGVVLFGSRPGPDVGPVPGRQRVGGVARFGPGLSSQGDFTILHGPGQAVAASQMGTHALRDGRLLTLALDPVASWGTVQHFWALPALASFLSDVLGRPMAALPAMGVVRYDDVPGTAAQQVLGRTKGDRRVEARIRRIVSAFRRHGAVLNAAVTCRALEDGSEVPLDRVWPRSLAALAEGIQEGTVEQVCHGYLHLDRERSPEGAAEPREFAHLSREEARRRIDAAVVWAERVLGRRPPTFVAPNWAYSPGTIEALSDAGLPAWLPFRFGPLVDGPNARESLVSTVNGLNELDYGPLAALAGAGLPPFVVIHGGLIDARFDGLRGFRRLPALARLAVRRDLVRLPGVAGLRWVGAGELLERLHAHDAVEVAGDEIRAPDGVEVAALQPAVAR